MFFAKVLAIFMSFTTILGQELVNQESLVELKLTLQEDKLPSVINYILNNSLELHDITTQDIIQLSKLDQYDETDLLKVFRYYNVTEVYTVDNLEILLTTLNITFGDFYRALTARLELSNTQSGQIINDLSIPPDFWQALAMSSDNIFDILRQGIYDQEHVNAALQTASKTLTEVYTGARDLISETVQQMSSTSFMELLRANGWTRRSALALYEALNITTSDVYQVEKFRNIFLNISETLNENVSLGIFVGPEKLAVHKIVYGNLQKFVDGVYIKVDAKGSEAILSKSEFLGENIVGLSVTPARSDYIKIVDAYNDTEECVYLTNIGGDVKVWPAQVENFVLEKSEWTQFVLGGALVCDGRLHGLAREENETVIFFDRFYTEYDCEQDGENDDFVNGANIFFPTFLTFVLIIALL